MIIDASDNYCLILKHYAELKKPDTKEYILYDSSCTEL